MGNALQANGDLDAALGSYKRALELKPDYAEAHNNMGNVFTKMGEADAAIKSYERAIEIKPDYADAYHNISLELLSDQKFEQGFKLNEWRWKVKHDIGPQLATSKPLWDGERGHKVFVWAEQGIGDEIMFSSLILEAYSASSKLIIHCDKRLIPLYQRSFPQDIVYHSDRSLVNEDSYDFHIPIGSLARIFRTSVESFPDTSNGFLRHDVSRTHQLRQQLLKSEEKTLIGISWKTASSVLGSIDRNIALSELAQIFDSAKTQLVCLQYGEVSEELDLLKKQFGINVVQVSRIDNRNDIDGLASLIMACDKIVSTTNATVHLAGALGADVKVLLPFSTRWFWGRHQSHCLWYNSVTSYRQNMPGDWSEVLDLLSKDEN